MSTRILLFSLLSCCPALPAVVYSFTGSSTGNPPYTGATFELTIASAITANATFSPGPDLTCNMCVQVQFFVDAVAEGFTQTPSQAVVYGFGAHSDFFYFQPKSFITNGIHDSIILTGLHDGQLTVRGAATSVPEPGTVASFAFAGLAGLAAMRLRR